MRLLLILCALWVSVADATPKSQRNRVRTQYRTYRKKAARKRVPFRLTLPQFRDLWGAPCTTCGNPIEEVSVSEVEKGKGYHVDNIVVSCPTCKKMRGDLSLDQWFTQMWKVLQHNDVVLMLKDQPSSAEMRAKALGIKVHDPDRKR